jgi:hypothetical protein
MSGMLRAVVENFLRSLTEREFDAPLLAILSSQGFFDIHFIHGQFEFGKDVIAKRKDADTGVVSQYLIQSKAGDIGQPEWRELRPQLEECEYNTLCHPSFDETLSRVAVLVTTGRLKGAAPVDAQQFKQKCEARGLADFEVWDIQNILDWLCNDPSLGLTAASVQNELIALVSSVNDGTVTEPMLERFSRRWLEGDADGPRLSQASIEASIICNLLRNTQRLDLSSLMSLHLYRAAWRLLLDDGATRSAELSSALALFIAYASELLGQIEPLLDDPKALANRLIDPVAIATYPVACNRMIEIFGLLALVADHELTERATEAVRRLCSDHPGCHRPPADQFAASLIPPTIALARSDRVAAIAFLRLVSEWLLDRHDPAHGGLGLGDLEEDEEVAVERLLGGALTSTQRQPRRQSYIATVVLDLMIALGAEELYEAVRENFEALRIVSTISAADEKKADWRRGGHSVWPQPRVEYRPWKEPRPNQHSQAPPVSPIDAVLLSAVCRSRHYPDAVASLLAG